MSYAIQNILGGPRKDLKRAKAILEELATCESLEEFEAQWQDVLARIERAWQGVETRIASHPNGQNWISKYAKIKKKDQLLNYMKQARNSEWHVVSSSVNSDILLSLTNKAGGHIPIKSIRPEFKEGVLTIHLESDDKGLELDVKAIPGQARLSRIQNRGTWYDPPKTHLDIPISDLHPVAVGVLCVKFYEDCFNEAENMINAPSKSDT